MVLPSQLLSAPALFAQSAFSTSGSQVWALREAQPAQGAWGPPLRPGESASLVSEPPGAGDFRSERPNSGFIIIPSLLLTRLPWLLAAVWTVRCDVAFYSLSITSQYREKAFPSSVNILGSLCSKITRSTLTSGVDHVGSNVLFLQHRAVLTTCLL